MANNQLYALYEGDWPTVLDSETLETKGASDLNWLKKG